MKRLGFTITDGWAFRFLFTTGFYKKLIRNHRLTLICSSYYYNLISNDFELIGDQVTLLKLEFSKKNFFFIAIPFLNFLFSNSRYFEIRKFHILKNNCLSRQFLFFIKLIIMRFINIELFYKYICKIKLNKPFIIEDEIDEIFFLSPYLKEEIALSLCFSEDNTKLCFVLPSWDNIYKYYTFKHYDSYLVWGESQQFFLKNILNINSPIYLKGPISQYVFNNYKMSDSYKNLLKPSSSSSSSSVNLLYCTITSRNFPNEVSFVKNLINKINSNEYGKDCHLAIRLHPAEKDLDIYRKLVSKKVSLSYAKGVISLANWDVSDNFFSDQIDDLIKSDIVICVASTITLDAIMLGRPVINFKPRILNGKVDYYDFEHYRSITNSNELEIVENMNELDCTIKKILRGEHKDYKKAISKEVYLHNSPNVLDYLNMRKTN